MVDAAICGFAVGAGFAILENVQLLGSLPNSNIFLWVVRGFGTAVMHGGATALFGTIAKTMHDRYCAEGDRGARTGHGRTGQCAAGALSSLPGLLIAVAIHSLYNHFLISPELSAIGIVIALPGCWSSWPAERKGLGMAGVGLTLRPSSTICSPPGARRRPTWGST
jgi:RsiW-degrading membrane proteinase PrsW (M82 family)